MFSPRPQGIATKVRDSYPVVEMPRTHDEVRDIEVVNYNRNAKHPFRCPPPRPQGIATTINMNNTNNNSILPYSSYPEPMDLRDTARQELASHMEQQQLKSFPLPPKRCVSPRRELARGDAHPQDHDVLAPIVFESPRGRMHQVTDFSLTAPIIMNMNQTEKAKDAAAMAMTTAASAGKKLGRLMRGEAMTEPLGRRHMPEPDSDGARRPVGRVHPLPEVVESHIVFCNEFEGRSPRSTLRRCNPTTRSTSPSLPPLYESKQQVAVSI